MHTLLKIITATLLTAILVIGGVSATYAASPAGQLVPVQQPLDPLKQEFLDDVNPLLNQGGRPVFVPGKITPAAILARVLDYAFPLAGVILLVMLSWAGLEIVTGASDKKSVEAGRQRATAALIGFGLLFISYWLVQIIEVVFGVTIFG